MLLTVVGGYLDAYTFISRDGVFANAQTGNLVFFTVAVVHQEWNNALKFLTPIMAFILGVLVSETIKQPRITYKRNRLQL